jgi:hypothetical protein
MIISHVKIIAFQLSLFCKNYRFSKIVLYIINRKIHGCAELTVHCSVNTSVLKNVRQHQQHRYQEIFNKISLQEIFLHLAGNVCNLNIYWNTI